MSNQKEIDEAAEGIRVAISRVAFKNAKGFNKKLVQAMKKALGINGAQQFGKQVASTMQLRRHNAKKNQRTSKLRQIYGYELPKQTGTPIIPSRPRLRRFLGITIGRF